MPCKIDLNTANTLMAKLSLCLCSWWSEQGNRATEILFSFFAWPSLFGLCVFVPQPNQEQPARACRVLIFLQAWASLLNVPFPCDQSACFVLSTAGWVSTYVGPRYIWEIRFWRDVWMARCGTRFHMEAFQIDTSESMSWDLRINSFLTLKFSVARLTF